MNIFNHLGALTTTIKALYAYCVDQTQLQISGPTTLELPENIFLVHNAGDRKGRLVVTLKTSRPDPVEITKIEIRFRPPFQLVDPDHRGFFHTEPTSDNDLPFCMSWKGNFNIQNDLIQAVGVDVDFTNSLDEVTIEFAIHAKRLRTSISGFSKEGRNQITIRKVRLRLTDSMTNVIYLPSKNSLSSPHPYIFGKELTVHGTEGPIVVHRLTKEGIASTEKFLLKRDDGLKE